MEHIYQRIRRRLRAVSGTKGVGFPSEGMNAAPVSVQDSRTQVAPTGAETLTLTLFTPDSTPHVLMPRRSKPYLTQT